MAGELKAALDELHTLLRNNLPDLRQAPRDPPEQANAFPFMIISPGTGEVMIGNEEMSADHEISLEIHTSRTDLPRDVAEMTPYFDLVKDILGRNLNGTSYVIGESILTYTFGVLGYAGIATIGWDMTFTIHLQSNWNGSAFVYG